ncbi:hypothetical protein Hanom_Chr01g00021811 [Helianthus anomalus]
MYLYTRNRSCFVTQNPKSGTRLRCFTFPSVAISDANSFSECWVSCNLFIMSDVPSSSVALYREPVLPDPMMFSLLKLLVAFIRSLNHIFETGLSNIKSCNSKIKLVNLKLQK